ncbi:MAG: ATP-binding protein [Clostridia bacterium]|nr:ATP-binding protein [Clostridia bacterium]
MMTDSWWISTVDHRISTALIFFLLLFLLGNHRKRRPAFPLRMAGALFSMCFASWCIRYIIDTHLVGLTQQGMGYSLHILVMSLLYWGCYTFCYRVSVAEQAYFNLLALTIFKLAWNTFKMGSSATSVAQLPSVWSRYSITGSLVSYVVYIAVCVLACAIHRRFVKNYPSGSPGRSMLVTVFVFMGCQMILEFCGHVFTADNQAIFLYYLCALMYTTINYVVLLAIAQLNYYRQDNEDMHNFIKNKMQYYQMSHDGIISLQIKCHDLKHQIAAIRSEAGKASFDKYIARLEDSINEYSTVVDCGNETINVVLTEKNILCSTCGVKFSYIIDGTLFDFMSEMEIYSLFGNALDNALENCSKVSDHEKRVISLKAAAHGEMVVLHVENFFDDELNMVDGMPVTTKNGSGHGFGLRSIQEIAEKYGGVASVQADHHIFKLTVFMKPRRA